MQIHNLVQGSPEWHAYRDTHKNASDAPAMMGVSPYKTRSELLREYATGVSKGIYKPLADKGHGFEALARPMAEKIIGKALYPVVGSDGEYSASFDGIPAMEDVPWEHKSLNDSLRACLPEWTEGGEIYAMPDDMPMVYQIQMEQQAMVSKCERILFTASTWNGDTLVEARHCWYTPDLELRKAIVDGWAQFDKDVAAYEPPAVEVKLQGRTPENLPALRIELTGSVTASNLAEYKAHALEVIEGINTDLQTDQDFADADKTTKWCDDIEKRLAAAKDYALGQTASIAEALQMIDDIIAASREKRLSLSKLVKSRKDDIKAEKIAAASLAFAQHVDGLNKEIAPLKIDGLFSQPNFIEAAKNKRTLTSLQDALDSELATAKIATDNVAKDVRAKLNWCRETAKDYGFLFKDMQSFIGKAKDDFELLVNTRISDYKAELKRKDDERIANEAAAAKKAEDDAKAAEALAAQKAAEAVTTAQTSAAATTEPTTEPQFYKVAPKGSPRPTAQTLPIVKNTRAQIDEMLDTLDDTELSKVLNMLNERYPVATA